MVRRMSYEIIEKNKSSSQLVVFGILNRGALFADALSTAIADAGGAEVARHNLDVSSYRDDVKRTVVVPSNGSNAGPDVTNKDVLLVDDVLHTGRTVRAALDAIVGLGRPRSIQLAVLIDRGHREYPVQPTYVGYEVPTKHQEHVEVVFDEGISVFVEE